MTKSLVLQAGFTGKVYGETHSQNVEAIFFLGHANNLP